ncbi:MAG: N-acetylglucosamine-6-phosphate deacetylase [Sciscionella sp.]
MIVLAGARVVLPDRVLRPGWVRIEADRIAEVGAGLPPAGSRALELTGRWLVPGFVDIHAHGGGGATYTDGDACDARAVARFHRRHGVTSAVASLVTAPPAEMERATAALADLVDEGVLAGIHLEGPFLSTAHCGAHDPALLRTPDPTELTRLLRAGRGAVRQVTLAPELPGALDLVRRIVDACAVAAVGHTDATYRQARAAFAAGATLATHLFNGMPPLHHREPGPVGAAFDDERVTVELINDGIHLHDAILRTTFTHAPGRVALVTDAMAAAGMGPGDYRLGSRMVRVEDGVARLADGSSIAGSTLTMDSAVWRAVKRAGVPLVHAIRAAATTPAGSLGLELVGVIAKGKRADLVVLGEDLTVDAVMARGTWEDGQAP